MFVSLSNGLNINVDHIVGFDENKKILYVRPMRDYKEYTVRDTSSTIDLTDEDIKKIKNCVTISR